MDDCRRARARRGAEWRRLEAVKDRRIRLASTSGKLEKRASPSAARLEHRTGNLPLGLRRPSAPRSSAVLRRASGTPRSAEPAPLAPERSARRALGAPRSGYLIGALALNQAMASAIGWSGATAPRARRARVRAFRVRRSRTECRARPNAGHLGLNHSKGHQKPREARASPGGREGGWSRRRRRIRRHGSPFGGREGVEPPMAADRTVPACVRSHGMSACWAYPISIGARPD